MDLGLEVSNPKTIWRFKFSACRPTNFADGLRRGGRQDGRGTPLLACFLRRTKSMNCLSIYGLGVVVA